MNLKHFYFVLGGIAAVVIFVLISQISQSYSDSLQQLSESTGVLGILSYIGIMAVSITVAPIGTGFLLPVAANSWGPLAAATYSIVGWTIGAMIAFWLSRKYGLALVKSSKLVQKLRELEKVIPQRNVFVVVVLLRIAFPVDLLSYALGIFSSMSYTMFFWSTIIGISPFAIIMMYATTSTVMVQIIVLITGSLVTLIGTYYVYVHSNSKYKSEKKLSN